MTFIPFTQFLRPDGRTKTISIDRPDTVAAVARTILDQGYRFECEVLTTGDVSLTITNDDDGDVDVEVTKNGPGLIGEAVDRLITRFAIARAEDSHV